MDKTAEKGLLEAALDTHASSVFKRISSVLR